MGNAQPFVYRYDGSFPGFLCCVAQCFFDKRLPAAIQPLEEAQATLFPIRAVATDGELARRVERSIPEKISPEAYGLVRSVFLTCLEEKELRLLRFLLLGYKYGAQVTKMAANDDVYALLKAARYLKNEVHFHEELLRFSDCGEFLAAVISPNNMVLPFLAPHFCDRFSGENLMIYDRTHQMGFLYRKTGRREFFYADSLELPDPSEEEEQYRALWKTFYHTVAVEGRTDHKLRRTHMPMRYWKDLTEFQP